MMNSHGLHKLIATFYPILIVEIAVCEITLQSKSTHIY